MTNTSTHDIFLGLHIYRKQLAAGVIPPASFTAAAAIGLRHVIAEQQAGRGRAAPADVSQTPACSRRSIFFRLTADGDVAAQLRAAHAANGARRPPRLLQPPSAGTAGRTAGPRQLRRGASCWSVSFASKIRGGRAGERGDSPCGCHEAVGAGERGCE